MQRWALLALMLCVPAVPGGTSFVAGPSAAREAPPPLVVEPFEDESLNDSPPPPPPLEEKPTPEKIAAIYDHTFRCTIYYTPREAGVTANEGFDMTPETRPGLGNRRYPRDFLRAVKKEGFGLLREPVEGKSYLQYAAGKWNFAEQPVDRFERPLVPRQTCAISQPHKRVERYALLSIRCAGLPPGFSDARWRVSDCGSGLHARQLDLYWGEDDPLGPGRRLCRPKGFQGELVDPTIVVLAELR